MFDQKSRALYVIFLIGIIGMVSLPFALAKVEPLIVQNRYDHEGWVLPGEETICTHQILGDYSHGCYKISGNIICRHDHFYYHPDIMHGYAKAISVMSYGCWYCSWWTP